jgi:hypothetical protein
VTQCVMQVSQGASQAAEVRLASLQSQHAQLVTAHHHLQAVQTQGSGGLAQMESDQKRLLRELQTSHELASRSVSDLQQCQQQAQVCTLTWFAPVDCGITSSIVYFCAQPMQVLGQADMAACMGQACALRSNHAGD